MSKEEILQLHLDLIKKGNTTQIQFCYDAIFKSMGEWGKQECMELIQFMYASCAETIPNTRPALWNIDLNTHVTFEQLYKAFKKSKDELDPNDLPEGVGSYVGKSSDENNGWISVDNAPKDGTPILGYDPNTEEIYKVWWCPNMGDGCWNYDGNQYIPKITHWQPLPKPPIK